MSKVIGHADREKDWSYTDADGNKVDVPHGTFSVLDCPFGHMVDGTLEDGATVTCPVCNV